MEKFKNVDIIIVKDNLKNKIIELINKDEGLNNIKIMSLEELKKKYYFCYDEQAIYYLMTKYNYQIDVAKMYLSKQRMR